MIALVTGASGAIGGHLAKRLVSQGHQVVSVRHDDHPFDTAQLLGVADKVIWARGSILDERFVKRVVADYAPEVVFHLAALPITQAATRTTVPIFQTNLMGTVHILEAIKENNWAGKVIRLIHLSTDKVYGDAGAAPYTEDMPLNALAPYDCSKACADQTVRTYAATGFIPKAAVARGCNIIAPGDLNFGRVFPRTIIPAMRGEPPIIYRTEYLREFMYIDDAVDGLLALDDLLVEGKGHGEAFNIGSGVQRSLENCVREILCHFPGVEPNWIEAPKLSRIEIPYQKLDTTKIEQWCGWKAKVSFIDTVTKLIAWWRDNWDRLPVAIRNWRATGWH